MPKAGLKGLQHPGAVGGVSAQGRVRFQVPPTQTPQGFGDSAMLPLLTHSDPIVQDQLEAPLDFPAIILLGSFLQNKEDFLEGFFKEFQPNFFSSQ